MDEYTLAIDMDEWGNPILPEPEDDELVMSLGVNDYFMGIFRTSVLNVLALMDPVE